PPVTNLIAGATVTVFAGSISLSNANGTAEAQPGQSAVLAQAEAPLFLAAPQDKQEELLRRLEQLAALVAKLEDEVTRLEQRNKQLKAQLSAGNPGPGGAIWAAPGTTNGAYRVIQSAGGAVSTVIIEGADVKIEKK